MKKRHMFAALLLGVLLLAGCNQATNKGFYLYKSSPIGFRIEYPELWTKQVDLDKKIAAFITPKEGYGDAYRDNITVSFETLEEREFADFFSEYYASLPATFAGFTEESKEEVLLDNKEAYKIVFSSTQTTEDEDGNESTAKLRILQYVVKVEKKVYFVTFIAQPDSYDYFLPFINTMLETLSFTV